MVSHFPLQLDPLLSDRQTPDMRKGVTSPTLHWPWAPEPLRAAYSVPSTFNSLATHSSNVILKLTDNTAILGLISNNNETFDREEVNVLVNEVPGRQPFSLNVCKTKEMTLDFVKWSVRVKPPFTWMELRWRVSYFKYEFLCVFIHDDLSWSRQSDVGGNTA